MTPASMERKIKRLEAHIRELQAEVELAEMIAHDIGAPGIIRTIEMRFPAIAAKWSKAAS